MRGILCFVLAYLIIASLWAVYAPLTACLRVAELGDSDADGNASEAALRRAGAGATWALRQGLEAEDLELRLRCARLLALQGHRDGDRCLLKTLRDRGEDCDDTIGAMAEAFLISVWTQRAAPPPALCARVLNIDEEPICDADKVGALSECISRHPTWAVGYVRRARVCQRNGDHANARRDALLALTLEPDEYEAMVILAEIYMALDAPEQAWVCLEQAVRVNPRLKKLLREHIQDVRKAIEQDDARRRRERRRERPVA